MSLPVLVGISGASGAIYGVECLRMLNEQKIPVQLIVSELGAQTLAIELDMTVNDLRQYAEDVHSNKDPTARAA